MNSKEAYMEKGKEPVEKVNVTFRMGKDRIEALDELGKCYDRDRSYLVNEAVEEYLVRRQWQVEEVKRALAEVEEGKFLTEEELLNEVASWGA
jgi:predicted transcriptional regulator